MDGIPNRLLRKTSSPFHKRLAIIVNHCLNIAFIPQQWKDGELVPVHKADKVAHRVNGYRPITRLSNISKVWERVVKEKLETNFLENVLIPNFQFGFMPNRSTVQSLMIFGNRVASRLNQRIPAMSVSLDVMKAFDSVDHALLVAKLSLLGIDDHMCAIVRNYVHTCKIVVLK